MSKRISFYSIIDGVENVMPIVPSSSIKYEWTKRAADALKNENMSTARCPGIFAVKSQGWILRTWQDIKITVGDNWYKWETPSDQPFDPIGSHSENLLFNYFENWHEGACREVIKFNTPWLADIPKGYVLNQFHPAYVDENRFMTLPGTYRPEYGLAELNIPVIWLKQGEHLIKAGTPIAQFTLCKKEDYDHSVSYITPEIEKKYKTQRLLLTNTYSRIYKRLTDYFSK